MASSSPFAAQAVVGASGGAALWRAGRPYSIVETFRGRRGQALRSGGAMSQAFSRLAETIGDRYRIEEELGRGGMASVYLAHDLKHDRRVAIKFLRPEWTIGLGLERFLREIRITAQLNHAHILPLLDSGAVDGLPYYVMPAVEGETLRSRLDREKQLPIDEAVEIARDVAEALEHAHGHGVVHRDIKPDNILLRDRHAVVADFGIARAVTEARTDTVTGIGMAIGTPLYMSPEQVGAERDIDGRSDIYSLGCVLFEMLAGRPPFTGSGGEDVLRQHLGADAPSVTTFRSHVSPELADCVQRSLAKEPAARFDSAEFGRALRGTTTPRRRWLSRRARVWAAAAVLLVGGGALASAAVVLGRDRFDADTPRELTIIAEVEGTADPNIRTAIGELVRTGLDQSGLLVSASPEDLRLGLRLAGRADTATILPELARELAFRGSIRTVVTTRIDRLGENYMLTIRVFDAENAEPVAIASASAVTDDALISAVERSINSVREQLGERPDVIRRSRPLEQIATPSFAAYRLLVEERRITWGAGHTEGVALLREALALDPDMAAGWLRLATRQAQQGKRDSARLSLLEAERRPERLTDENRIALRVQRANIEGDHNALVVLRRLQRDRNPQKPSIHNSLAVALWRIDRWEEALAALNRADSLSPYGMVPLFIADRATVLSALGRASEAEADARRIDGELGHITRVGTAISAGDWTRAESLAVAFERARTGSVYRRVRAQVALAGAHAAQGELSAARRALARARETSVRDGSVGNLSWVLRSELGLALASGRPVDTGDLPALADPLTAVQWLAVRGDAAGASRTLASLDTMSGFPGDPSIPRHHVEGAIAAARGDWPKVVELMGPSVRDGVPVMVRNQESRWLVAQAYERLGRPDSAAVYYELITSPLRLNLQEQLGRGIAFSFAHQRLVVLYARMGRIEDARRHWRIFSETFTNPDREIEHLVEEAREALLRAERSTG